MKDKEFEIGEIVEIMSLEEGGKYWDKNYHSLCGTKATIKSKSGVIFYFKEFEISMNISEIKKLIKEPKYDLEKGWNFND